MLPLQYVFNFSGLDPKLLEEDELQKIIPIVTEFVPNEEEDLANLIALFKVTSAALKSRDEDLNEAIEALDNKEADREMKNENKKLKKEIKELKKDNKELDKQVKRLQTAKHEGGTDAALEDLLAVEQALEQAQKENREMVGVAPGEQQYGELVTHLYTYVKIVTLFFKVIQFFY